MWHVRFSRHPKSPASSVRCLHHILLSVTPQEHALVPCVRHIHICTRHCVFLQHEHMISETQARSLDRPVNVVIQCTAFSVHFQASWTAFCSPLCVCTYIQCTQERCTSTMMYCYRTVEDRSRHLEASMRWLLVYAHGHGQPQLQEVRAIQE